MCRSLRRLENRRQGRLRSTIAQTYANLGSPGMQWDTQEGEGRYRVIGPSGHLVIGNPRHVSSPHPMQERAESGPEHRIIRNLLTRKWVGMTWDHLS